MIKPVFFLAATLVSIAPAWAINKCTGPDGKTVFQDAPCAGKGEKIEVKPASGSAVAAPAPALPPMAITPSAGGVPVSAPLAAAPAAPSMPAKTQLETQADTCLAWYRPLLRDPASAYYSEPKFEDKRVMRMTLHAKNGYGGVQVLQAVCEFENGKFSESWTKLQAKRIGWKVD